MAAIIDQAERVTPGPPIRPEIAPHLKSWTVGGTGDAPIERAYDFIASGSAGCALVLAGVVLALLHEREAVKGVSIEPHKKDIWLVTIETVIG